MRVAGRKLLKQVRITRRQLQGGLRVVRGHLDLLIIADITGPGVMICMKPRPTGKEPRDLKMGINPRSPATIVIESLT